MLHYPLWNNSALETAFLIEASTRNNQWGQCEVVKAETQQPHVFVRENARGKLAVKGARGAIHSNSLKLHVSQLKPRDWR